MATSVKISQLASVTAATDDDVFVINDANTNTRKITYANLTRNLVSTDGDQTLTGDLSVSGTISASSLEIESSLFTIDPDAFAIGIGTDSPRETLDVNGNIRVRNAHELQLGDRDDTNHVSFKSPTTLTGDFEYIVPALYPTEDGQVLSSTTDGNMSWVASLVDPTTSPGDVIIRNSLNNVDRLGIGLFGQVLTVGGNGTPVWQTTSPSFPDPMTTRGDMIFRNGSNITTRLPVGTAGQFMIVGAGGTPTWADTSVSAAGSTSEIQFNLNGSLEAVPELTFDIGSDTLSSTNVNVNDALDVAGGADFRGVAEFFNSTTAYALFDARGNVSLGSNNSNTLQINSLISTALLPTGGNNIGADSLRWGDVFIGNSLSMTDGSTEGLLEYESNDGFSFYGQGSGGLPARLTINSEESTTHVTIQSPLEAAYTAGSYVMTLPVEQGAVDSILVNDGTGQLSWDTSSPFDLQDVTDNGAVTTDTIAVGGLVVEGQTFPGPGAPEQVLATDSAGNLIWAYVDADLY